MTADAVHAASAGPRRDVEFESGGVTCRAWLTSPEDVQHSTAIVVMAHGFGGTKERALEAYAHRFQEAGYATLIFDYRSLGASQGEPRNDIDWRSQLEDWHAAVAFARTLPGVDPLRVALWGTSFAGGLVVKLAARDPLVAAIICQCPLFDGRAASLEVARYAGLASLLRTTAHGLFDAVGALLGRPPHYVPVVAHEGELGAMTSRDAVAGFTRLGGKLTDQVTARSLLRIPTFRPIVDAHLVKCPALLQICERDTVAPVRPVEQGAARMQRAEVVRYPVGHFDVYVDAPFEQSVSDQVRFLRQHVVP